MVGDVVNKHIRMLKECCAMRGLSEQLIHRTIREFGWFCSTVIWGDMKDNTGYIYGDEGKQIYNKYRRYYDDGITLEKWIELFYDYCKHEYGDS